MFRNKYIKFFSIAITIMSLLIIPKIFVSAEAGNNEVHSPSYLSIEDYEIELMAVDACPGYGRHDMVSRGWGTLIKVNNDGSKETIFTGGSCLQCSRCREVLVTEYDPLWDGTTGYYAMRNPGYVISAYGAIIEASAETIKYTSENKVPYCILRYS